MGVRTINRSPFVLRDLKSNIFEETGMANLKASGAANCSRGLFDQQISAVIGQQNLHPAWLSQVQVHDLAEVIPINRERDRQRK